MNYYDLLGSQFTAVVPALWFFGRILKLTNRVKDCLIPFILCGISIVICCFYSVSSGEISSFQSVLMCAVGGVNQGVIACACAVFGNQLVRQSDEFAKLFAGENQ